ncbi:jg6930, partial [Pararge aegeria aegeria]
KEWIERAKDREIWTKLEEAETQEGVPTQDEV